MTNFRRKTLILNPKKPKFTSAQVEQIMTNFQRKMILNAKTTKFTSAGVTLRMTNF